MDAHVASGVACHPILTSFVKRTTKSPCMMLQQGVVSLRRRRCTTQPRVAQRTLGSSRPQADLPRRGCTRQAALCNPFGVDIGSATAPLGCAARPWAMLCHPFQGEDKMIPHAAESRTRI